MNCSRLLRGLALCLSLFLVALHLGCESGSGRGAGQRPIGALPKDNLIDTTYSPGDKIVIEFDNGLPQQWQQVVREDGSITLPLNKSVIAAGKRKGHLEKEIQEIYVPKILARLTVNVRSEERSYFVTGEVRLPGQKAHTGLITALKAIGAAGDFTDFANKSNVEIIRASGDKIHMNAKKALDNPALDIPVYPGDRVHVHRRFM